MNGSEVGWAGASALMAGIGVLVAASGWLVIAIARRAADGRLGPNGWVGIRTRATRSSEAAWVAAHTAGYPMTLRGGVAAIATSVAAPIVGVAVGNGDAERAVGAWGVALAAGGAVVTGLVVVGAVRGHAAAARVAAELSPPA